MAKARTLFNEFNILVLLPNREELDHYFDTVNVPKADNWAVFKSGEIIFASNDEAIPANAEQKGLNGAFYLKKDDATFKLNLITI